MSEMQQTKYSTMHKKMRVEKKKNVVLYKQAETNKGAAKRLLLILTYMYFIQRET